MPTSINVEFQVNLAITRGEVLFPLEIHCSLNKYGVCTSLTFHWVFSNFVHLAAFWCFPPLALLAARARALSRLFFIFSFASRGWLERKRFVCQGLNKHFILPDFCRTGKSYAEEFSIKVYTHDKLIIKTFEPLHTCLAERQN